jgi:Domain of unknown function (DUF4372)
MYKVCSIFSQVLKLFSRGEFEKAVKEHKAERHARGFTSWGQFMAMLFCQLGRAHSLREICGGLACCEGQLKHLGVPVAPKKSTLAYVSQWNFSLQRSLSRSDSIELEYLGASGHQLVNVYDLDQCRPSANLFCDPATKPWPRYSALLYVDSTGNSSSAPSQVRAPRGFGT